MSRLFYAIGAGLIGAILLHIIVILAVPSFTGLDAYSRVLASGPQNQFHALKADKTDANIAISTPFMKEATCAFTLEDGPVFLSAVGDVPFWSLAIYDPRANEVFSMNDRTAIGADLSLIIGNDAQLVALRKEQDAILERSILVEVAQDNGYAVLRALYPEESMEPLTSAFIASASCASF